MRLPVLAFAAALAAAPAFAQAPAPTPEAVVQRQVEAYNRGDVDAFVAAYAPNAELIDFGADSRPTITGHDALKAAYGPMFARAKPKVEILSRMTYGAFVADREKVTAGTRVLEAIVVYEVQDGLIRRVWLTP